MTGTFKDHFSGVAAAYQSFRPRYPEALFRWLADQAPARGRAVDLGCGSGQASVGLAAHFHEVIGVDPSAGQVAQAEAHPRVRYLVAPAEATGLAAASADLILAAQAFHWFDQAALWPELSRIVRPGGVFAACSYALVRIDAEVDAEVDRFYAEIGPDWPPERVHVESGYRTLPFPWPALPAPELAIAERWDLPRFLGYLGTWSAVSRRRKRTGADPVAALAGPLGATWGPAERVREIRFPLAIRAGRRPD